MYQGKFQKAPQEKPKKTGRNKAFLWLYLCLLLLNGAGLLGGMGWLGDWLTRYEAAQPDAVSRAVFEELFADPDWGSLYDRAGMEAGDYEGREAFVAAMEEKVKGGELACLKTSSGLSDDRKYLVRLGEETVASFTLTDRAEEDAELPDWELGRLELFLEGSRRFLVTAPEGATVTVNGKALGEEAVVMRSTDSSGDYLPVGVAPPAVCTYAVTGLLAVPEVTVLDKDGHPLTVICAEAAGTFRAAAEEAVPEDALRELALKTVRTYGLYMIKRAGQAELAKYFNTASDTYKAITGADLDYVQRESSREFTEESVSRYCRYNENLFSVRVQLNLKLYRSDGSAKDNFIDRYLFFSREDGGKWLCYAMTAVDVSRPRNQVRLTFCQGERVLLSEFFPEDGESILCPLPEVPEGKTFSGWMVEEAGGDGETVLQLVFTPDADGKVILTGDTLLTPMTLYPMFA